MTRKRHLLILAALMGLACLVQTVVIRRATVTGLDAVRFVEIAQAIDRQGILETIRGEREQPLFPVWVWAVHRGLQRVAGTSPSIWAVSAQVAAAIPLVLAVAPFYLLTLRLAGRAAAVAGSVFFCVLPEVSRLGADGISDSTHLLLFCVAFWSIVEYLKERSGRRVYSPLWLLLAGVSTAAALLARTEVLLLAVALALVLVAFQLLPRRRQPCNALAAAVGCFVLGPTIVLGPYLTAVQSTTPRTALARVLGLGSPEILEENGEKAAVGQWHLAAGEPMSFDVKEPTVTIRRRGLGAAVVRFGRKLLDAMSYWVGALALIGSWHLRRGRKNAADRFVQVFFVLFSVAAIRFCAVEGYLVPRHLLGLVVAGTAAAGYGATELGGWIANAWLKLRGAATIAGLVGGDSSRRLKQFSALPSATGVASYTEAKSRLAVAPNASLARGVSWAVVAAAAVACFPQTLIHLHHSRLGHRQAGQWLAAEAEASGRVLDTIGWTGLYSGRQTYGYENARRALGDRRLAYVVLEQRELEFDSDRSRTLRNLMQSAAEPVGEFPPAAVRRSCQQAVVVYRWYPDRFARLTSTSPGVIR